MEFNVTSLQDKWAKSSGSWYGIKINLIIAIQVHALRMREMKTQADLVK